jgi:AcrR family transcriptional regulator
MAGSVRDKRVKRVTPRRSGTKGMPRAERERQLLDLAERAFAERGYHAASMDEIASAAGVTKPIIYSYFGSKEGLFIAGVQRAYERCVERVEVAAAEGGEAGELLVRVIQAVFGFVEDYRGQWPYIFGAQALGGRFAEEAAKARAGMVAVIARILRQIITDPEAAGEIDPLAEVCIGACEALANRWVGHPEEPRELQEARAVRILGPAIAALAQGPS